MEIWIIPAFMHQSRGRETWGSLGFPFQSLIRVVLAVTTLGWHHHCSVGKWDHVFLHSSCLSLHFDSSVPFSSVAQSCPTLCEPVDCSTPGLPVHHQLPEFDCSWVYYCRCLVSGHGPEVEWMTEGDALERCCHAFQTPRVFFGPDPVFFLDWFASGVSPSLLPQGRKYFSSRRGHIVQLIGKTYLLTPLLALYQSGVILEPSKGMISQGP